MFSDRKLLRDRGRWDAGLEPAVDGEITEGCPAQDVSGQVRPVQRLVPVTGVDGFLGGHGPEKLEEVVDDS